ncbi:hypothetical protein Nepgr_031792 [Nepenthes gracilis]|uniref:Uncharacterized protein n=1 Tax=Nepenthes gracilis TaxID=150966 RepID=A0AAD3TIS7_NEPGR|nr:hypothetical protein Nepgr_031792 [Nepenthes gracilis]
MTRISKSNYFYHEASQRNHPIHYISRARTEETVLKSSVACIRSSASKRQKTAHQACILPATGCITIRGTLDNAASPAGKPQHNLQQNA